MSELSCPHCGGKIEIEAKRVQAELGLGPIGEVVHKTSTPVNKKTLDRNFSPSVESSASARADSDLPIQSPTRRGSVDESNRIESNRDANRIAPGGEDLIESVQKIVGEVEWSLNGSGWKWRERFHYRALLCAVQDWRTLTPAERAQIRNRGAWLTDRFKRAGAQLRKPA